MPVDLHCHTKVSDGSSSVDEVVFMAKRMGLKSLAITDHDTFVGSKRGLVLGNRYGLDVIFGAELSSFYKKFNKEIHILCYMCDYPDRLEGICSENMNARRTANTKMIDQIIKFFPISSDIISSKARESFSIFKNHIVQAVMDTGFIAPNYSVIYEKLFGSKSIIKVEQAEYVEPEEIISKIHQAGGIAVLAHPQENYVDEIIPSLVSFGIDGIEIFHTGISLELKDILLKIIKSNDLLGIGGSNFHGMYSLKSKYIGLCTTPDNQIELMKKRKLKISKTA